MDAGTEMKKQMERVAHFQPRRNRGSPQDGPGGWGVLCFIYLCLCLYLVQDLSVLTLELWGIERPD